MGAQGQADLHRADGELWRKKSLPSGNRTAEPAREPAESSFGQDRLEHRPGHGRFIEDREELFRPFSAGSRSISLVIAGQGFRLAFENCVLMASIWPLMVFPKRASAGLERTWET